jgi:hypothetical protein
MELADWLQAIARRRWPILPDTRLELRTVCGRHPDLIRFTDLANLCLSDPLLLFDLLRYVGASRALQRSESSPSVEAMLMMVGLEGVVKRLGPLPALAPVAGQLSTETLEEVGNWLGRSRVAAHIVKEWLSIAKEVRVDDCFVAALTYNLPACFYLLFRNEVPERPLLQAVADQFGSDYPKVLEAFVRATSMPTALLQLYGPGTQGLRRQVLRLAVATANALEQGWWRPQWSVGIEAAARLIGCTYDTAYEAVVHATLTVAHHPRVVGYTYPARQLIMLEGEYRRPKKEAPPDDVALILSDAERLEIALRTTLQALGNDLKFERVMFWSWRADSREMRLRYHVGLHPDSPLLKLRFPIEQGSFMAVLTGKPQSFHAPAAMHVQLSKKYSDPFLKYVGDGDFVVMSVFAGNQLAGVFYADNPHTGRPVDADTYGKFKTLISSKVKNG